jgi:hypothetical protein
MLLKPEEVKWKCTKGDPDAIQNNHIITFLLSPFKFSFSTSILLLPSFRFLQCSSAESPLVWHLSTMPRVVLISQPRSTVLFGKRSSFQPMHLRCSSLLPMMMSWLWSQVWLCMVRGGLLATVFGYLNDIYKKLGVSSRMAAMRYAIDHHLC